MLDYRHGLRSKCARGPDPWFLEFGWELTQGRKIGREPLSNHTDDSGSFTPRIDSRWQRDFWFRSCKKAEAGLLSVSCSRVGRHGAGSR